MKQQNQSGDFEDSTYEYDYDITAESDRWSGQNEFSLDDVNAGITFGVMARVTKQQDASHFQKALKLSCWNSNMIRDMNNDNKFSTYFLDQVEYKRFFPGIGSGTNPSNPTGGTVDTTSGADDLSWLYAVGDLRTGYNHQYGFEHNSSDPYYPTTATETDRMGKTTGSGLTDGRNDNRLRQLDEASYAQPYDTTPLTNTNRGNASWTRINQAIDVKDKYHLELKRAKNNSLFTSKSQNLLSKYV